MTRRAAPSSTPLPPPGPSEPQRPPPQVKGIHYLVDRDWHDGWEDYEMAAAEMVLSMADPLSAVLRL